MTDSRATDDRVRKSLAEMARVQAQRDADAAELQRLTAELVEARAEVERLRAVLSPIAHTNPGMLDMQRAAELAEWWIAEAARALAPKP